MAEKIDFTNYDFSELDRKMQTLIHSYEAYSGVADEGKLYEVYEFAKKAHSKQKRNTGEPYITHPVAVAEILIDIQVDRDTLTAALLHDVVEDTEVSLEDVEAKYGSNVALLVNGVTKLSQINYSSKEEEQAENFRKMFLAMAKDIRVVLIKLADRLHNMRTMKHKTVAKQIEKSKETLDIYAPLAHRLGIYKIKWELEDLCLRFIDPDAYYHLVGAISQKRSERESYLEDIVAELNSKVASMHIPAEIEGRPKHFYSIYRKMKKQHKSLDEIYDLFATRIIVPTVGDCYAVLGVVHELYKPMPGRFKDYIAMPKPNMYQSLHSTVIGPKGMPFEVQIRTYQMHRTAEYGIAAHWKYKEGKTGPADTQQKDDLDSKLTWLRSLLEWQKDLSDAHEFMDTLKSGLVLDEVFVFTPKGEVRSLPAGSVPVDFAYQIHSGVGNSMYGAKVNGKMVPMSYKLQNGDIVEILTSDKVKGPSRDWLDIVASNSTKSKISAWFKKQLRGENVSRGREILEREIKKTGFTPQQLLKRELYEKILKRYTFNKLEDLCAGIGYGGVSVGRVVPRLKDAYIKSLDRDEQLRLGYRVTEQGQVVSAPKTLITKEALIASEHPEMFHEASAHKKKPTGEGVVVKGLPNALIKMSRCCSPVPGDAIIGYVTRGKGVAIHRTDCPNIRYLLREQDSPKYAERTARLIDVEWDNGGDPEGKFQVELNIIGRDRPHLLADVSNAIAEEKVPILSGQMQSARDISANFLMVVEVKDQNQLKRLLGRLKAISGIIDVKRGH